MYVVIDHSGNTWRHGCVTNPPKITTRDFFPQFITEQPIQHKPATEALVKRCLACKILLHGGAASCPHCLFSFVNKKQDPTQTNFPSVVALPYEKIIQGNRPLPFWQRSRAANGTDAAKEKKKMVLQRGCNKYQLPLLDSQLISRLQTKDQKYLKNIQMLLIQEHPLSENEQSTTRLIIKNM